MAAVLSESGLEEGEYESDSDGASALALRRREASDDEEREMPLDAVSSAGEDDDEDDDDDVDASQHSFSDEEGEGEGTPPDGQEALVRRRRLISDEEDDREGLHHEDGSRRSADKEDGSQGTAPADATDGKEAGEEEKKDAEPFVVPTAGAFYMHDDRFRGVAGARPRRGVGGSRKLWEAKDEKPWVHDLFEELNVRDDSYRDEGLSRGGRGRSRGRGRVNRDRNRGWVGKLASDSEELYLNRARRGRGRGRPARSEADHSRVEETGPSTTKRAHLGSTGSSNVEGQDESKKHESTAPRKVVAGSLNSASPPFFPSSALQHQSVDLGSESNQIVVNQSTKGKERATRSGSQVFVAKSGGSARGLQAGGALQSNAQSQQPVKLPAAQTTAQNAKSSSGQGQPSVPLSAQPQLQQARDQEAHAPGTVTQASSGSFSANLGQSAQPARPKGTGGRGGRGGNIQVVGGRGGSFVYHGGPATGMNNGVQKVEPGFAPPIPAVGPVAVQYAGHPPAGIPLPAVGMAMPNYSGQPQYGFPNSEVTWIPVLAGGGAMGAGYATPYMTMEGTPSPMYFSQPAAQPPSFRPAGNSSKPSGLWKPPPNQELGPDDFGHRQSKPRRYSEMNFGQ